MIEFKKVYKRFGSHTILNDINFVIKEGEILSLIGPSGSGKSTLLRCINKLELIDEGQIIVNGIDINSPNVNETLIRQEVGMVFQHYYLFPHMTALDNVAFGLIHVRNTPKDQARQISLDILDQVGLSDKCGHFPSQLSGGQQQRVAIARALAIKPKVILFDEPTSALDPELSNEVLVTIKNISKNPDREKSKTTIIIVTHEIQFAASVSTRLMFLEQGKIAADGHPKELLNNPPNERLQEFLQHVEY